MTPNGARRTAHGAVSAIIVLAVVGPATGLEAHLPTGVLWCRHPRARAPVFSSQVDEAKSAAQIDEEWFPAGADEETLKKHFRRLAAREHPDVSTAPDADDRFQTLTAEYTRLMEECRSGTARLELAQAWASLGGAYLAVSIAFNDPALSALITTALGSIKLAIDASNAEGYRWDDEGVGLRRLRASLAALAPAAKASLGAGLETVSGAERDEESDEERDRHSNLGPSWERHGSAMGAPA